MFFKANRRLFTGIVISGAAITTCSIIYQRHVFQAQDKISERITHVSKVLHLDVDKTLKKFPRKSIEKSGPFNVNEYIDHTVLKSEATSENVKTLCQEAIEHKFPAVCVNLSRLDECTQHLKGTTVKKAVVVGFPLGATSSEIKANETLQAVMQGANEIDMVINVGKFLDGDYAYVLNDIRGVVNECKKSGIVVKVILETSLLKTPENVVDACVLCVLGGTDFVKTSTGFFGGADKVLTKYMCETVGGVAQIKASGGVRTRSDAIDYLKMGVTRIGTSNGISIMKESGSEQNGSNKSSY
jgi:deoxyribose-phosphate aldolase